MQNLKRRIDVQKVFCRPWAPGTLASEYGVQYTPKAIPNKGDTRKRKDWTGSIVPFNACTIAQQDYKVAPKQHKCGQRKRDNHP
jgi:hypothetical protein